MDSQGLVGGRWKGKKEERENGGDESGFDG